MIGGSVKVLVYVLAAAFNRCRLDLLTVETSDQVILCPLLPQSELSSYFYIIKFYNSGDPSTARDEGRATGGRPHIWTRPLGDGWLSPAAG